MDAHDEDTQAEDDAELRELLTRAAESPTVHRERVLDAGYQALNKDTDLFQRLRDHDGDDEDVPPV